jgi:hypothetical protein
MVSLRTCRSRDILSENDWQTRLCHSERATASISQQRRHAASRQLEPAITHCTAAACPQCGRCGTRPERQQASVLAEQGLGGHCISFLSWGTLELASSGDLAVLAFMHGSSRRHASWSASHSTRVIYDAEWTGQLRVLKKRIPAVCSLTRGFCTFRGTATALLQTRLTDAVHSITSCTANLM